METGSIHPLGRKLSCEVLWQPSTRLRVKHSPSYHVCAFEQTKDTCIFLKPKHPKEKQEGEIRAFPMTLCISVVFWEASRVAGAGLSGLRPFQHTQAFIGCIWHRKPQGP